MDDTGNGEEGAKCKEEHIVTEATSGIQDLGDETVTEREIASTCSKIENEEVGKETPVIANAEAGTQTAEATDIKGDSEQDIRVSARDESSSETGEECIIHVTKLEQSEVNDSEEQKTIHEQVESNEPANVDPGSIVQDTAKSKEHDEQPNSAESNSTDDKETSSQHSIRTAATEFDEATESDCNCKVDQVSNETTRNDKEAGPLEDIEPEKETIEDNLGSMVEKSMEFESEDENENIDIGDLEPDVSELGEEIDSLSLASTGGGNFDYDKHNESLFDDERIFPGLKANSNLVKFADNGSGVINHATLKALIVQLTSPEVVDYDLICDFFLTYRVFVTSEGVMNYLLTRLVWSLQYINSQEEQKIEIGKSTLLRTFVVLRHWIINYFLDDFSSNYGLCDNFIVTLNEITNKSNLLNNATIFEKKIICDLKNHWISQIDEFCNTNIRGNLASIDILEFPLPRPSAFSKFKRLPKSTTNMSLHTNPSYRRSAMLSLYDQGVQHKCIIYDDNNTNDENPQMSMNNLLLHHSSDRFSLNQKIKQFNEIKNTLSGEQTLKKKAILKSVVTHNHMNLKDSSLALKQISRNNEQSLSNVRKLIQIGFATNGSLKLPKLDAGEIRPPTPTKKMEYRLKEALTPPSKGTDMLDDNSSTDVDRKRSLKKIVDGWKKPFNGKSNEFAESKGSNRVMSGSTNPEEPKRMDILSARIVDELEFLIRNYINEEQSSNGVEDNEYLAVDTDRNLSNIDVNSIKMTSSPNRKVQVRPQRGFISAPQEDNYRDENMDTTDQMDINDISELNFKKIDGLFNSSDEENSLMTDNSEILKDLNREKNKDASFVDPVSINWNDASNIDFESTAVLDADLDANDERSSQGNMTRASNIEGVSNESSISTPSNLTEYKMEVADLGIVASPSSKRRDSMRGLSLINKNSHRQSDVSVSGISLNSNLRRGSVKSYLSYDSAFSISNNSPSSDDANNNGNLRKKHGFHNLRTIAGLDSSSPEKLNRSQTLSSISVVSRSSSIRKSVRYSTLYALKELPFPDTHSRKSKNVKSIIQSARSSGIADSSIFSVAVRNQKKSMKVDNELADISDDSLTNSVAIPGISNYVLKELAAIPDESFSSTDPIEVALHKLEGKNAKGETEIDKQYKNQADDSFLNDFESHQSVKIHRGSSRLNVAGSGYIEASCNQPTESSTDILEEINNANTKDAISLEVGDYTQEPPLRPALEQDNEESSDDTISKEVSRRDFDDETTNFNHTSPKLILEGYFFSSNILTVKHVLENNCHISFVLSYDARTLAEHFTLIEQDILQEIDWKDLIEHKWSHKLTPVNSWLEIIVNEDYFQANKGVNLVIARFNLMVNWIVSEILLTKFQQERINLISRFIHIAQDCLALQNFSTLMQIILALTSEKVQNLKGTWRNVYPGDILMLKSLEELASPLKNFLNYRLRINNITPSKGCIPFLALYLSDLTFNSERPTIIKSAPTNNTSLADSSSTLVSGQTEPMINFSKFRTSVHVVKSLSQLIEWSTNYKFSVNHALLSRCLYIKSLDEEEMNLCTSNANDF